MTLANQLFKIAKQILDLSETELTLEPFWTKRNNQVIIEDNSEIKSTRITGLVIENGVHRAVSAQERGEKSVRAKLNWPGKGQFEIEVDVRPQSSPLLSPKAEIDFDRKYFKDPSPIEVSPLQTKSTLGLTPLNAVGRIGGKNKPRIQLN